MGAAGGLRGTITPPKAIKGNRSVCAADKLFVALPGHKDICLCVIVSEALTKFVPVELLRLFSPPGSTRRSRERFICRYEPHALSFIIRASDYAPDKPDSLISLSFALWRFARQLSDPQYSLTVGQEMKGRYLPNPMLWKNC